MRKTISLTYLILSLAAACPQAANCAIKLVAFDTNDRVESGIVASQKRTEQTPTPQHQHSAFTIAWDLAAEACLSLDHSDVTQRMPRPDLETKYLRADPWHAELSDPATFALHYKNAFTAFSDSSRSNNAAPLNTLPNLRRTTLPPAGSTPQTISIQRHSLNTTGRRVPQNQTAIQSIKIHATQQQDQRSRPLPLDLTPSPLEHSTAHAPLLQVHSQQSLNRSLALSMPRDQREIATWTSIVSPSVILDHTAQHFKTPNPLEADNAVAWYTPEMTYELLPLHQSVIDSFYAFGFTGSAASVMNIEAGHAWAGHDWLNKVTTFVHHEDAYGTSTNDLYDRHATWVSALIAGSNYGIAYNADLQSGAIASEWADNGDQYAASFQLTNDSFLTPYQAAFGTVDVINSSWGAWSDTPETPDTISAGNHYYAAALDVMAYENPNTTLVVAAGNNGESGTNSISSPGSGYNGITVGATASNSGSYDQRAAFSSYGPIDYYDPVNGYILAARAGVDLVAPGSDLVSAFYGGATGGNLGGSDPSNGASDWISAGIQGTSFAAPLVAGVATLLHDVAEHVVVPDTANDSRVIKAILLNSATKLAGWDNGQVATPAGGVQTSQALDYELGAGQLNPEGALNQILPLLDEDNAINGTMDVDDTIHEAGNVAPIAAAGWDLGTVTEGGENSYFYDQWLDVGTSITTTLSWFRESAFDIENTPEEMRQSNLDLYIYQVSYDLMSISYIQDYAFSYSSYDTVEHLSFDINDAGYYLFSIVYLNDLFDLSDDPSSEEKYGFAWDIEAVPEASSYALILGYIALARIGIRRKPRH